MWIINCILLMIGTVAAVMGISFFIRNREASGNIRLYIFCYGICSAIWCISYGLIGISDNFELCEVIRKFGIFGYESFFFTEVLLATEMSGIRKRASRLIRWIVIVVCIIDFCFFAQSGVNIFIREGAWTTWRENPDYSLNRLIHTIFIVFGFLLLLTLWFIWNHNARLKRMRRFLFMALVSNCIMLAFTLPDFFLPMLGYRAVTISGIGGAACAIVMWYGATRLTTFDIRMGNIKDRIFDFLEAGIIVMDTDHRIAMINRYAGQLTEQKKAEKLSLSDFFRIEEEEKAAVFPEAEMGIYSARLWDKSGKKAYSVRIKSVEDEYGEPFCYMCVFLDVTDEVEAASKLEIASQAKSRFLAQMSHEIRTPINAVLGMNEMILREAKNPDILEYSENIDSAGNTLLTLINSILDFSKIEDGKMDIIPVRYGTASFINDLVNSVAQRADTKGLAFRIDVDESLPCALIGDDVRLSQVIMNLLTNAVKYTEKGTVTLSIRAENRDETHILLHVAVSDTGIGIRKEDIDRLFVSFERLDEVRNHNIEGTGLGISIVKSLLTMMGSQLEVESTYGEGSKFFFTVKQEIADPAPIGDYEKRVRNNHREREEEDLIRAPYAKVLVVDDNSMNLKVTRNLLKLCGIKPELVSSGEEAISFMRKKHYHCVFLDHMMPGMDGLETLARLQEEGLVPEDTAMIALTANAVVGAREAYLAAGFQDYLSKPVELKELVQKLKIYLPEEAYEAGQEGSAQDQIYEKDTSEDPEILEFLPTDGPEIMEFSAEDSSDASAQNTYNLKKLSESGIDTDTALNYCAGSEEFYYEMLDDFTSGCTERADGLENHYEKKDWRQYGVLVHSMKSNLRTIGATELSERARLLEEAAKKEDITYITENHGAFLPDYRELAKMLEDSIRK